MFTHTGTLDTKVDAAMVLLKDIKEDHIAMKATLKVALDDLKDARDDGVKMRAQIKLNVQQH